MTPQSETRALREALEEAVNFTERYSESSITFSVLNQHLKDALATPASREGWQSMESAPKDGTRFVALIYEECSRKFTADTNAYWASGLKNPRFIFNGWAEDSVILFGWQPLPAAPDVEGGRNNDQDHE